MKNKYLKYFGNVLMILSLFFIIIKLKSFEIDYSMLLSYRAMTWVIILTVLFGIHIFLLPIAWRKTIIFFTEKRIPFLESSLVFCKSNILKYIPGNIFQYIGRNEIAIRYDLSHVDVGISTLVDVLNNIIGVFIIALLCYFPGVMKFLSYYKIEIKPLYIILPFLAAIILALFLFVFRRKLVHLFNKYKKIFSFEGVKSCLFSICIYCISAIYTGGIYILVDINILQMKLSVTQSFILMGTYLFSWIVGFIIPGAPGGIGIREAVFMILLENKFNMDTVLLGIVIYRFINIFGDLAGLLIAKTLCHKKF